MEGLVLRLLTATSPGTIHIFHTVNNEIFLTGSSFVRKFIYV